MSSVFLTAKWEYLILITYEVPEEVILPHLPKGTEPDKLDGKCFASLVAFNFTDTRIKGIKIPYHINFPEINLRFYVKRASTGERGVVFIREFVPKIMIEYIANIIYNEPYKCTEMKSELSVNEEVNLEHNIKLDQKDFFIKVLAKNEPYIPAADSKEHFFKEHSLGFGITRKGNSLVYRVEHPVWAIFPLIDTVHNFDFGKIYGKKWEALNTAKPYNITFARGSEIKVFGAEKMKE